MTRLAAAGLAGHVFFELGAGVGMPFASILGPVPAAGLWTAGTAAFWRAAKTGSATWDSAFALVNSVGLAAVVAHLTGWPARRTRVGLPWLRDCEGLGPDLMRYYNPILYVGGLAAVAALIRENRSAPRQLPMLAAVLVPALVAAQHWEHERLKEAARTGPGWWNRRLQTRR
jgi:hypothetical protein